jgi:RHH-type transcriptional regulator, proline utilization regulon repressor / proline dehydrogenase / delta 1-pyrroline-5-carboxylate dehydrogenase
LENTLEQETAIFELEAMRRTILQMDRTDENICLNGIIHMAELNPSERRIIQEKAASLSQGIRSTRHRQGGINALMAQYNLAQEEGITLMCLAEALLRIPDIKTLDELIQDKLTEGAWSQYLGQSRSAFVNAATYGLVISGKLLNTEQCSPHSLKKSWKRMLNRMGMPVIRQACLQIMRSLGQQFVMGQDITSSIKRATKAELKHYRYSYDMLGETALTQADADKYFNAYCNAIQALSLPNSNKKLIERPGISIKLSAIFPRFDFNNQDKAITVLTDRVLELCCLAKAGEISLTIDAEEIACKNMTLSIFENVIRDPKIMGWNGLGIAIQAYHKSAYNTINWLIQLAEICNTQILVRLVKGAYWDYEIKDSQQRGLNQYPVFTYKANTDISYLSCAKRMLAAPKWIYPQFATHNVLTIMTLLHWLGDNPNFEFQCLHGMGEMIYNTLLKQTTLPTSCRIYAPVGKYQDLLPYLVRRLLENGANNSFINQLMNENYPISQITADPVNKMHRLKERSNPNIPLPIALYGSSRPNSMGMDLNCPLVQHYIYKHMEGLAEKSWLATPLGEAFANHTMDSFEPVHNPATLKTIGKLVKATASDVPSIMQVAQDYYPTWNQSALEDRAAFLNKAADLLESRRLDFIYLARVEAGKTLQDAIDEVREAIDFLRYYATEGLKNLAPQTLTGPTGETNILELHGRGILLCISPWNFPLAIFSGQISAALMAGNVVVAKPAVATSIIAFEMIKLFYEAGIPKAALHLLPGDAEEIGQPLITHPNLAGIMLTGSNATAKILQRQLAERPGPILPLIAETGGQNAMFVDSSALAEQVITDVIASAFHSAGQRCSALRLLCLQAEIAEPILTMLKGAMATQIVNDPMHLTSDIGPIIDNAALTKLQDHRNVLEETAEFIAEIPLAKNCPSGTFFAPCAYKINSIEQLTEEVFGPILHIYVFQKSALLETVAAVNNTGFGLTLGIHSRVDQTIDLIVKHASAGNVYVNRNMTGAVVGVQPFGGEGLSGTGPKAGGPHYLPRLCKERTISVNTTAVGGNATLMNQSACEPSDVADSGIS